MECSIHYSAVIACACARARLASNLEFDNGQLIAWWDDGNANKRIWEPATNQKIDSPKQNMGDATGVARFQKSPAQAVDAMQDCCWWALLTLSANQRPPATDHS